MKTSQLILGCLLSLCITGYSQAYSLTRFDWWYWYYNIYGAANNTTENNNTTGNTNLPPNINGDPATTVTEGQLYSFTPTTSDPEGDSLVFTINNLPAWTSFNQFTGTLTGTPTTANIGLYQDIVISVSDGNTTVSLAPISIMVNTAAVTTGSADISWVIPATRTDGTPLQLSEIDGFRIYMGATSNNLTMVVDLNDRTITRYTMTNLTSGTYYFAITTYDIDGNESQFSNIAGKSVM